jgi:hypothetical protein
VDKFDGIDYIKLNLWGRVGEVEKKGFGRIFI